MSSKTKIIVLRSKELIYTGLFVLLGILFVVLLLIMFLPGSENTALENEAVYVPGIYTTSLMLKDHTVDIEVVVDSNNINSIRIVNLDEAVTTMFPLIEPSFADLSGQILENQSLDQITYSENNKYTSLILLDAIEASLDKAYVTEEPQP